MIRHHPQVDLSPLPISEQTTHQLFEVVYDDLRKVAARMMLAERTEHTLSATALVNESYLRIASTDREHWDSRGHFFSAVAESMRRILIDRARARNTLKRSRRRQFVELDQLIDSALGQDRTIWLLELDDGIERLSIDDPLAAEFVKLRVFAGCSVIEAGDMLGLSKWGAYQMWEFVQRWFATDHS